MSPKSSPPFPDCRALSRDPHMTLFLVHIVSYCNEKQDTDENLPKPQSWQSQKCCHYHSLYVASKWQTLWNDVWLMCKKYVSVYFILHFGFPILLPKCHINIISHCPILWYAWIFNWSSYHQLPDVLASSHDYIILLVIQMLHHIWISCSRLQLWNVLLCLRL